MFVICYYYMKKDLFVNEINFYTLHTFCNQEPPNFSQCIHMGGLSSDIVCILIPWNGQLLRLLLLAVCTTINVITELGICSYCSEVWEWNSCRFLDLDLVFDLDGRNSIYCRWPQAKDFPHTYPSHKAARQDIIHLSHFSSPLSPSLSLSLSFSFSFICPVVVFVRLAFPHFPRFPSYPHFHFAITDVGRTL